MATPEVLETFIADRTLHELARMLDVPVSTIVDQVLKLREPGLTHTPEKPRKYTGDTWAPAWVAPSKARPAQPKPLGPIAKAKAKAKTKTKAKAKPKAKSKHKPPSSAQPLPPAEDVADLLAYRAEPLTMDQICKAMGLSMERHGREMREMLQKMPNVVITGRSKGTRYMSTKTPPIVRKKPDEAAA